MAFFLLHLPLLILNSTATFIYPLYASYKAITSPSRPGSAVSSYSWRTKHDPIAAAAGSGSGDNGVTNVTEMAELETWLMYWSVIACIQTVETFFEWSWSWLPFYFECKLIFTLWLVLPQTRGASYLYIHHVAPFLAAHEQDIDVALGAAKGKIKALAADWIVRLWNHARESILNLAMSQPPNIAPSAGSAGSTAAPPSGHNPAQGVTAQLFSLVRSYAPAIAAGANAIMDKATQGAKEPPQAAKTTREKKRASVQAGTTRAPAPAASGTSQERAAAARRRAELEKQLAQLDKQEKRAAVEEQRRAAAGAGGKPRAVSSAVRPAATTAGRRLASQPVSANRAGRRDDEDAASSDASDDNAPTPPGGEKWALDGSYAVLDKAEVQQAAAGNGGSLGRAAAVRGGRGGAAGRVGHARAVSAAVKGSSREEVQGSERTEEGGAGWGWLRG